jgi:hypothetical protein
MCVSSSVSPSASVASSVLRSVEMRDVVVVRSWEYHDVMVRWGARCAGSRLRFVFVFGEVVTKRG